MSHARVMLVADTALESQLGKPYDSIGIWDFATGSVYDLLDIGLGATVIASRG